MISAQVHWSPCFAIRRCSLPLASVHALELLLECITPALSLGRSTTSHSYPLKRIVLRAGGTETPAGLLPVAVITARTPLPLAGKISVVLGGAYLASTSKAAYSVP